MKLCGVCILTNDVPKLVRFYEAVFCAKVLGDAVHSSFDEMQLAIWNPGNVEVSLQKNMELMYIVEDANREYERLHALDTDIEFVSAPADMPWGVRAFVFKDPDGNKVNFLSPIHK